MVLPIALAVDGPRVPRMVQGFWCLADWNKATRQVIELIRHCLEQGDPQASGPIRTGTQDGQDRPHRYFSGGTPYRAVGEAVV